LNVKYSQRPNHLKYLLIEHQQKSLSCTFNYLLQVVKKNFLH
jgi:hypothetical protein